MYFSNTPNILVLSLCLQSQQSEDNHFRGSTDAGDALLPKQRQYKNTNNGGVRVNLSKFLANVSPDVATGTWYTRGAMAKSSPPD